MPTYDYLCEGCGHKFELFQSINDPVQRKCPKCKKSKLRRLFGTGAAVMFKGSGFYTTDYRSDSYKSAAKADAAKPAAEKTGADAAAKPAATPTTTGAADTGAGKSTGKPGKSTKT